MTAPADRDRQNAIAAQLQKRRVVPLIDAAEPDVAVAVASALVAGGLPVVEVVLRSENALECLDAVASEVTEAIVGAGTVVTPQLAMDALGRGAKFIVSPGLDERIVDAARTLGAEVFPGVATASEFQRAHNLGLEVVKFFPASVAGGIGAIRAFSSVFRGMRIMPTGGVSAENLAEYLDVPAVIACGGSWLTPKDAVAAGDFGRVSDLARKAVAIANGGAGAQGLA